MTKFKLHWQQAIPGAKIHSNQVQVWCVSLDLSDRQRERMLGMLSADEVARAGRFHFEKDLNRFIAARGILRNILGLYLGEKPHRLRFEYTPHGKPVLGTESGYDALRFNLSHSDSFALYAITRGRNIGIDIERIRYDIAVDQIVRRFFSPDEISSLEGIHDEKRYEVFFQYWTRKEAFLKAMGEGLSFPMEQCDVSLISGMLFSPVTLPGDKREGSCWYVQDLFPGTGYAAAIAIEGGDCELSCCHYSIGVDGPATGR
jgi:4'-phosphopantetheinyl transferase